MKKDDFDKIIPSYIKLLQLEKTIEAAWLTGSYGRREEDDFSDIDIIAYVSDVDVAKNVYDAIHTSIKTKENIVFTKTLVHSCTINIIDQDWNRIDISFVSEVGNFTRDQILVLFDKSNITDTIQPVAKYVDSDFEKEKVSIIETTEEFIRVLGMLPVVINRDDPVTAAFGVQLLKNMLMKIMGIKDKTGPKRGALSFKKSITPEHYNLLLELPALSHEIVSLIKYHKILANLYFPLAKNLYEKHNMKWPDAFEQAALKQIETLLA